MTGFDVWPKLQPMCAPRVVLAAGLLAGALLLAAGCSGDADAGDGSNGGGSGGENARGGAGGGSLEAAAGSGGSALAGGGSAPAGGGATYTAEHACDLFGRASCSKAVQCGLVLGQTSNALICAQCDALSLGIIQQQCLQDAPGDKDAGAVDRCVASLNAQACAQACADPSTNECEVFDQLTSASPRALLCDARCVR